MNKIAIIGAAGFVGSRLTESLVLDRVREVRAIVRAPKNLAKLSRLGSAITTAFADAQDMDALLKAISSCSTVINLVMSDPKVIIESTKNIYNACVLARVKRLIHISSAVVYGQVQSSDLNDDYPPLSKHWMPYARAKAESELFLREVATSSPVEITVLRPGIVWGPRSPWTLRIANDLSNNTAYLVGDGEGVCNSLYIDNLVSSILTCHRYGSDPSGFFNVSDAEFLTWNKFYESVAKYLKYDMSRIPKVPADRFRPSLNSFLENVKSQYVYTKIKEEIPEDIRASIKLWLKKWIGKNDNHLIGNNKRKKILVSREMWYLQTVKHKLPNTKFSEYFNYSHPFSFEEGVQRTINWLKFIGI